MRKEKTEEDIEREKLVRSAKIMKNLAWVKSVRASGRKITKAIVVNGLIVSISSVKV